MIIYDKDKYVDMMVKFLEALGYQDVKKGEPESTINITAKKNGKNYAFACRYDIDAISGAAMNEFIETAKKTNASILVFMTNSSFSSSAKKAGDAAGVELWDRNYIDRVSIGLNVEYDENRAKKDNSSKAVAVVVVVIVVVALIAAAVLWGPDIMGVVKK